ncbi:MAG: hypothetical protein H0W40_06010 [Methylibium sp.]|uniref:hypothetical protein n=1 Tax=Methylibium sp. TaxID=2067992 RepID=UPI0018046EEF|nr:hypothetical protein [Methylibium sp.]MBA3596917.1 hypothetical protein [Methylibium sp.]
MLSFGLAFGLGGKEAAAKMIEKAQQSAEEAKSKLEKAAEAGKADAKREMHATERPPQTAPRRV